MSEYEKNVKEFINSQFDSPLNTKGEIVSIPNKLKVLRKVHKKFGNFGVDIAKDYYEKMILQNFSELL